MGYFAARSAPLGVVPTEVVSAMFYNFSFDRVAKALPAAWEFASPADALRVREESAVAALRRYGVTDDDGVRTAAELAAKAARSAPLDGRPLFAANLALPWPDEPLAKLWHAVTLLREHRGDGHVPSGVIGYHRPRSMCCTPRGPGAAADDHAQPRLRRRQWSHYRDRLARRGLMDGDGHSPTDATSNSASRTPPTCWLSALTGYRRRGGARFGPHPHHRMVVAAGDVPAATRWAGRDDLDDDSALV